MRKKKHNIKDEAREKEMFHIISNTRNKTFYPLFFGTIALYYGKGLTVAQWKKIILNK